MWSAVGIQGRTPHSHPGQAVATAGAKPVVATPRLRAKLLLPLPASEPSCCCRAPAPSQAAAAWLHSSLPALSMSSTAISTNRMHSEIGSPLC